MYRSGLAEYRSGGFDAALAWHEKCEHGSA
jgi:hypothetical protein